MSVDLDTKTTWLVADTSVLINSLAVVRAIIDSNQPYSLYVPYIVLTELDQGSMAAAVNQLLCSHMKQKNPRIMAQGVSGHENVSLAAGIAPKNDDLIMGAALRLKEDGLTIVMLTNDNNLSVKCCANGLTTWSSLDLMCTVTETITEIERFIAQEIQSLCPHPDQSFTFCTELLMCALRFRLGKQNETSSISNELVYRLIDDALEEKIGDKHLLTTCTQLVKEFRKKCRDVSREDVRRFLRYVCALLEMWDGDKVIAKVLNICKGIFAGLRLTRKTKADRNSGSTTNNNKSKIAVEDLTSVQQKSLAKMATKIDTSRKRTDGIKKNTCRRKSSPRKERTEVRDTADAAKYDEMEIDDGSSTGSASILSRRSPIAFGLPKGKLSSKISAMLRKRYHSSKAVMGGSSSRLPPLVEKSEGDTEVDAFLKRPRQSFGPIEGDDVSAHPVHCSLETVWNHLHQISGTLASRYGVQYTWNTNLQDDVRVDSMSIADYSDHLGRMDDDYSRLLKLGTSVSLDLLLVTAARFIENLRKVCPEELCITPEQVIQFFQDDRTSPILWNGRTQLQVFRNVMIQCRNVEKANVLQRLRTQKFI